MEYAEFTHFSLNAASASQARLWCRHSISGRLATLEMTIPFSMEELEVDPVGHGLVLPLFGSGHSSAQPSCHPVPHRFGVSFLFAVARSWSSAWSASAVPSRELSAAPRGRFQ
jgi:hypothetical protein